MLLEEEENNLEWRSAISSLPQGIQGWAARATTNSLPTPDNLCKWKKMVEKTCPICGKTPCTLFHLLNNCQTSVNQKRYDYRHDSILLFLYNMLMETKDKTNLEIYADLEGSRVNGVTIPNNIVTTGSKPDLVIINRSTKKIDLVELTVPWDTMANNAKKRKEARYNSLVANIQGNGWTCSHTTLEIGSRGLITQRNRSSLIMLCNLARETKKSKVIQTCSKLALLGSYSLWVARHSKDWTPGPLLQP